MVVIPCLDFEAFLANYSLRTCNISFLSNLLDYILEPGRRILEKNEYSSSDIRPDLSWLPKSPSPSATSPSSQSLLSQRPTNSMSSQANVTTRPELSFVLPTPMVSKRRPPLSHLPWGVIAPSVTSLL